MLPRSSQAPSANSVPSSELRILLLCGSDLLESFCIPGLWNEADVSTKVARPPTAGMGKDWGGGALDVGLWSSLSPQPPSPTRVSSPLLSSQEGNPFLSPGKEILTHPRLYLLLHFHTHFLMLALIKPWGKPPESESTFCKECLGRGDGEGGMCVLQRVLLAVGGGGRDYPFELLCVLSSLDSF